MTAGELPLDENRQLTAVVRSANGSIIQQTVSWSVADSAVATISSAGQLTARKIGGTTVVASIGSIQSTPYAVTVGPGPPAVLAIVTQPSAAWSGAGFEVQPRVEIRDRAGNLVGRSSAIVRVALEGSTQGSLGGELSVAASFGTATFTNLSLAADPGTYSLVFQSSGLPDIKSQPLSISQYDANLGFEIDVGDNEEVVLGVGQFGMNHTPDGPISFLRTATDARMWFVCGSRTCFLRGPSITQLAPGTAPNPPVVFAGSFTAGAFDSAYAGAYGVIKAANQNDLLMMYHAEQHPCNNFLPFNMAVGMARSTDGGSSWTRLGQVARSSQPKPAPSDCSYQVWGTGQPTITYSRDGKYLYMYFNERVRNRRDELYLARALVETDGVPGAWVRYTATGFDSPLLDGSGVPVLRTPEPATTAVFIGNASISWNAFLKRYIMVANSMRGVEFSISTDGISWAPAKLLLQTPSINTSVPVGTRWRNYPSLLSFDQTSQLTTSRSGYLYFALGTAGGPPHHMVRRSFTIRTASP